MKNNATRALVRATLNANVKNLNERPLVINAAYTQYELLDEVSKETGFTLSHDEEGEEDFDIWWIDGPILATLLQKLKCYQRTNHLPNVHMIARKNNLAKNLQMM